MKNVLLLGSGLSAKPFFDYLTGKGYNVTIAARNLERARQLAGYRTDTLCIQFDADVGFDALNRMLPDFDVVGSFIPGGYQPEVAKLCVKHKIPLLVSCHGAYFKKYDGGIASLDAQASQSGIPIISELGVDCGYLGMFAARAVDHVKAKGGRVRELWFHVGVLPAACTNPFNYSFFWAAKKACVSYINPKAGKADWIKNGTHVHVDATNVYSEPVLVDIPGCGTFETHPNLDSGAFQYEDIYGIDGIEKFYHGTLRYPGWCSIMSALIDLGFSDDNPRKNQDGTYRDVMLELCGADGGDPRALAAAKLGLSMNSDVVLRLKWLGLFDDVPVTYEKNSYCDIVAELIMKKLGVYGFDSGVGSRVLNYFELLANFDDREERLTSVFDYSDEGKGNSVCSTLISTTTAIVADRLLEGRLSLTGFQYPYRPEVYKPVIEEYERLGFRNTEYVATSYNERDKFVIGYPPPVALEQ